MLLNVSVATCVKLAINSFSLPQFFSDNCLSSGQSRNFSLSAVKIPGNPRLPSQAANLCDTVM